MKRQLKRFETRIYRVTGRRAWCVPLCCVTEALSTTSAFCQIALQLVYIPEPLGVLMLTPPYSWTRGDTLGAVWAFALSSALLPIWVLICRAPIDTWFRSIDSQWRVADNQAAFFLAIFYYEMIFFELLLPFRGIHAMWWSPFLVLDLLIAKWAWSNLVRLDPFQQSVYFWQIGSVRCGPWAFDVHTPWIDGRARTLSSRNVRDSPIPTTPPPSRGVRPATAAGAARTI